MFQIVSSQFIVVFTFSTTEYCFGLLVLISTVRNQYSPHQYSALSKLKYIFIYITEEIPNTCFQIYQKSETIGYSYQVPNGKDTNLI